MRIIGDIAHPTLKITVFKMDTRITVKFENAQFEQSYKFRMTNQLSHLEDVKKLVDEKFIEGVLENFKNQLHTKVQAMDRFIEFDEEEEFEDIV
ncbi:MAG: hypothetical protein ACI8P3_000821 [Saprospiraceae bacterium]|jgi:hypothetical protein